MKKTKLSLLVASALTPLLATQVSAQTAKPFLLDTVTVIGTRTETSVKDNPASVSIVDRETIERSGADSVADLLRNVPGVSVVDSAVAGMKRIRIRGEQSNRVVILVDGQELTDQSSFGSPLLVDPSNIERIEVVRGPASVLYGAKAIGGVVNITTRKGAAEPLMVELGGGFHSGSNGKEGQAALSGTVDRFDYRLSVSADEHQDRKVAEGTYSDSDKLANSSFRNKDASVHMGMKLGEDNKHYVSLKANHHQLVADGWEDPFALVHNLPVAGIASGISAGEVDVVQFNANLPKRDLNKLGLYYEGADLSPLVRKLSLDAFYQQVEREFDNAIKLQGGNVKYGNFPPSQVALRMASQSRDKTKTYGGSAQMDLGLHADHYTLIGAQYLKDDLQAAKNNNVYLLSVVPPASFPVAPPAHLFPLNLSSAPSFDRASMQTASVFLQDEWSLPNDFKLIAGTRYYRVKSELDKTNSTNHTAGENSTHSRFVKSLGLTYTGLEHTTLRGSYSEGYVMPTLLEQFTDSRAGRGIILHGNPDLSPERSTNYELGLRYLNRGVVFDGTLFYTKAKNYITYEDCGSSGLCVGGDIYTNADKAKSYGAELLMEYWITDIAFTPYMSGSWMRRQIQVDDFSTYKTDTPALSGQLGVRYERTLGNSDIWTDAFIQAASSADKKERIIDKSGKESRHLSGWGTLNFAVGSNFGDEGQHHVAINTNNLLNKHYRASVDEMPAMGRNLVLIFNTRI